MRLRFRNAWMGPLLALVLGTGCVTPQTRAERAMEAGRYNEALDVYDVLIAEGSRDPQVFCQAARASVAIGSLAAAERHYSRALRYGGGAPVARELADFYVRTSNYASAVRVYQYLLETEEDVQGVYNNLGTALMYAGRPFDGESYLLLAQQLEPGSALPYLNLGLLYDRHLRQPWLAMGFYRCYVELAGAQDGRQVREVAQRFRELDGKWRGQYDPELVKCGERYVMKAPFAQGSVGPGTVGKVREIDLELGEGPPVAAAPRIERLSTDSSQGGVTPLVTSTGDPQLSAWFDAGRYGSIVEVHASKAPSDYSGGDQERIGISLVEVGRTDEGIDWLRQSTAQAPSPRGVDRLVDALREKGEEAEVVGLCERFIGEIGYEVVTRRCTGRGEVVP